MARSGEKKAEKETERNRKRNRKKQKKKRIGTGIRAHLPGYAPHTVFGGRKGDYWMDFHNIEEAVSAIEDKYIWEAGEAIQRDGRASFGVLRRFRRPSCSPGRREERKNLRSPWRPWRRARTAAACAAACAAGIFFLGASSLTAAVAAGSLPAYDILYSLYPDAAKRLTPVRVSCEDNGIRMQVEAVHVQEDTAEIYVSMRDLTGGRIDETIDLFDSYALHLSKDSVGTCSLIDFDPEKGEAFFLIRVQQMHGERIEGQKLVFSVSRFLTGKWKTQEELRRIRLTELEEKTELQADAAIRGYGGMETDRLNPKQLAGFLKPDAEQTFSPAEGVTITAWGWADGLLHIQAHYEDILNTDNHGYVYLTDGQGNMLQSAVSVSFWDEQKKGSYDEYVFEIDPEQITQDWAVWGYFSTCAGTVEGEWRVEIPIEEKTGEAS